MHYTAEMNAAWQPTPEALIDVIDYCARITLRSRLLSREDFEDARSSAVVRCWEVAQRTTDKGRAYFFTVARYAILEWLQQQRARAGECSYDRQEWAHAQAEHEEHTPAFDVARLRAYGAFTDHEIAYLHYCVQGFPMARIAQMMSVHPDAPYRLRAKLLPRLYHLAGQAMPAKEPRRAPLTDEQCLTVYAWREAGVPWREIASRLEYPVKSIYKAHRRARAYKARAAA